MSDESVQAIAGVLGIACLVAIIVVLVLRLVFKVGLAGIFPDAKPSLSGKDPFPRATTYFLGLTASIAFTGLIDTSTPAVVGGALLGAAFGVIALLIRGTGDSVISRLFRALVVLPIAILAFGPALGAFVYPSCAGETLPWVRPVLIVVVTIAVVLGLVLAFFRSFAGNPLRPILAVMEGTLTFFSAFKIAAFLLTPFGLAFLDLGVAGWIVTLAGLGVLIFACFVRPLWVLRVGGVAIVISNLAVFTFVQSPCGAPNPDEFFVIVGYSAVYLIVGGFGGAIVTNRITKS